MVFSAYRHTELILVKLELAEALFCTVSPKQWNL